MKLINLGILLALIVVVTACSTTSPVNTTNNAQTNAPLQTLTGPMITDTRYENNTFLISGDTLDAGAQNALNGFNMTKTLNEDGTTTINLTSTNPEYQNQSYILQQGEKLYFMESNLGDDSNNTEGFLGDDRALIVDSDGNILNAPNPAQGRFGNMTDAQRTQLNQVMVDACNGRAENDTCSVTTPNGDQNGTCMLRNSTLRCASQRFNGPRLPPGQ